MESKTLVHIAQSCDVVIDFVSLLCQLSQVSRDYTVSAPLFMNIRVKSSQMRHFPTVLSYSSGVTHVLLPANSF
ncbi:hypothetical protein IGI04_030106 [Brassica rapa subsp. trilocularis]|uniref:Uncharacterized protein n=1 Tax=Brassica rapa subsp. trilocularis TaxID=1813537 RepID=A0ABQ7LRA7_BRACM|nr:hypothetical protein IGI04_030106 [Brassica rapa subsp. trilocularis]